MHNILSTTDVFSKVADCKNLTAEIRHQYDDSFFQKIDEYLGAIEYGKTKKEELEDSDDYDSDDSDSDDSVISEPQQGTIENEKMELAYGFPPFPYPIPTGVDPSMHMHMLTTDPVYKAKYYKDRLKNEKVFKEQIDRYRRDTTLLDSDDSD